MEPGLHVATGHLVSELARSGRVKEHCVSPCYATNGSMELLDDRSYSCQSFPAITVSQSSVTRSGHARSLGQRLLDEVRQFWQLCHDPSHRFGSTGIECKQCRHQLDNTRPLHSVDPQY